MAENEDNIVDVIIEPDPTDPTEELKKGLKSNHFLVIKDSLENGADLRLVSQTIYRCPYYGLHSSDADSIRLKPFYNYSDFPFD